MIEYEKDTVVMERKEEEESLEARYASLHQDLIALVDKITILKTEQEIASNWDKNRLNDEFNELINQKLDPIIFLHLNKKNRNDSGSDKEDIVKLNAFLKNLIEIKNLIFEQSLITLPILNSINNNKNNNDNNNNSILKEKALLEKVNVRDELSLEYMKENVEIQENVKLLYESKLKLSKTIINYKQKLNKLNEILVKNQEMDQHQALQDDKMMKKNLKKTLKIYRKYKLRSTILSELIISIISSTGLNWSQDEYLKEVVLYCGDYGEDEDEDEDEMELYYDQSKLDEISDDSDIESGDISGDISGEAPSDDKEI
ncbi:hypothetical protein PACTADRAFT_36059 [Pachysolen tannophilus NRRL Y-2460]|uniref:Centromere protein H C-terminal domain-containing protein n=1 Tax=Pachysolen tannophilus NRRL Y-2460 TaxID=669874 RepID=A0A1E4TNX6_PACTA|nr:hypothetical protein PACTADRAFT_36059 [Pachysolen tannophilus NRRL Y-2460]